MKHLLVFVLATLLSTLAVAKECTIDLNYTIRVSSEFLEVSDEKEVIYKIVQGGALAVKGEPVDLSAQQKRLTEEYAGEVAALVPQWINLVSSALAVAEKAIKVAFEVSLDDEDSAASQSARALASVRARFEENTSAEKGIYSISVTSFNDIDGAFSEGLDDEIEDIVASSLGSVFAELAKTMMSSEDTFAQRIEALGERMDRMGQALEGLGQSLEDTAQEVCAGVKKIRAMEEPLAREIPRLAAYRLFGA